MALETLPFDAAPYFSNPEDQAELLAEAFETGEVRYIALALGTVARAKGMSRVAEEAGITRQGLHKLVSEGGDPKLSTLLDVAKALGFRMTVVRGTPMVEADAFQDRTIEARETAEEAVVAKDARVVEEIGLREEAEVRTETVRDTVRRTEVEVKRTEEPSRGLTHGRR